MSMAKFNGGGIFRSSLDVEKNYIFFNFVSEKYRRRIKRHIL
jgi:hypothetical protein